MECETYGRFLHIVHIIGQRSSRLNYPGTQFDDPRPSARGVLFFFLQPAAGLTNRISVRDSRAGTPLVCKAYDVAILRAKDRIGHPIGLLKLWLGEVTVHLKLVFVQVV